MPPVGDGEALVREMRDKLEAGRWERTAVRRVLTAALALFGGKWRDQTTFAALLRFYVKQTADHDSATFLSGMVACYVATFVPGARHSLAPVIAWR